MNDELQQIRLVGQELGELSKAQPSLEVQPRLAACLSNLANALGSLGRRNEALVLAKGAIEIYRAAVQKEPGRFGEELAGSLNNLANRLSELGRRSEALAPAQEAVELYRALARQNPDAFRPDLARSFGAMSQVLAGLGRHSEAAAALAEGIDALQSQFARLPEAFAPLMETLVQLYQEAAQTAGIEPDETLLKHVKEVFDRLEKPSS